MGWNDWQVWRRDLGRRPLVAVDGSTTSTAQESALWKSTMLELFGPDWAVQLVSAEVGQEDPSAQPREPRVTPAAGAGATGAEGAPPLRQEVSPGSGIAIETGAASPGSGHRTPRSWTSRSPGTPTRLTGTVMKSYRPDVEPLEKYADRIVRQATALAQLGEPLAQGVLEGLLAKAKYELRLHEEAKENMDRQVRILKREYAFELLDVDGTIEQAMRLEALETLLTERNVDAAALKVLIAAGGEIASTPSKADEQTPPQAQRGTVSQDREPRILPAASADVPHFRLYGAEEEELEKLRDQLKQTELELAAHKVQSAIGTPAGFAQVMEKQTELLQRVLDKPKQPGSTIRVEPKVTWPRLGDDGPGGKEVEEFYEKFEDICGLANNGSGMSDKEMTVALKTCLHGSRKKIYENVLKAKKSIVETEEGPGEIYRAIKKRLFRFLETSTERRLRVRNEWNALNKVRGMSALQFEAEWEQIHADLDEVGLGINPLEKFLAYIVKVGPPVSETIRMDRRPRADGSGGTTTRLPETWEECHEVLCEIEGVKAGSKAFTAARAAGLQPDYDPGTGSKLTRGK